MVSCSSSTPFVWVHHVIAQLSHFSDSLAVTSGFAVTFLDRAYTRVRVRGWNLRAFHGISLHIVSGRLYDCFLNPLSEVADARGRWALHSEQFRCQHGLLLDCIVWILHWPWATKSHFSESLAVMFDFVVSLGAIVSHIFPRSNCSELCRSRCQ